jgi:hypothetical protein
MDSIHQIYFILHHLLHILGNLSEDGKHESISNYFEPVVGSSLYAEVPSLTAYYYSRL